jgi:hypothetical protein
MTEQLQIEAPEETKPKRASKNGVTKLEPAPLPVVSETAVVLAMIERVMTDPNVSMERANQAFDFYQKVQADQARKAFDAAMADAKAEIPPITKNRRVGFDSKKAGASRTDYKHEDMAEIARTVDPILSKHGLSYRFRTTSNPNEPIHVTCIVSHRLGYSDENSLTAGRDDSGNKNSIQAIGSTITYLQRYTLKAALGLSASNDDDGKSADNTPADDALITEAQASIILDLVAATNTKLGQLLAWAKVEDIANIRAEKFDEVVRMLKKKQSQNGDSQ